MSAVVLNHRACEKTVRGKANHPSGVAEGKQVYCALPYREVGQEDSIDLGFCITFCHKTVALKAFFQIILTPCGITVKL